MTAKMGNLPLKPLLGTMGMTDAFGGAADFSGIDGLRDPFARGHVFGHDGVMLTPRPTVAALAVALATLQAACSADLLPTDDAAPTDARDGETDEAADGADAVDATGDGRSDRYVGVDGGCAPGVPHCHGDFGYRQCEQDGTWSESHSCAGYSSNGTTSYCAEIPMDDGETWATCVDPACWYWLGRGAPAGSTAVGICLPDGTINKCSPGATLSVAACDGVCTRVATLDARALGYCAPACADGARECLGGPFYRTCAHGRWEDGPKTCDGACNPLAGGTRPDVRCGGACDPGTSRCRADLAAVETCSPAGTWALDRACTLGRCRPAGPQAECEAECATGQHACAFDGAGAERRCDAAGRWTAETACAANTTCRLSGDFALGCVACVGARPGGGNAYGAADSRCTPGAAVELCGDDGAWQAQAACPDGNQCVAITRGPSSLAACQPL